MKNTKYISLILMLLPAAALAQGEIHQEEVKVVKSYNPMVDDAFKINLNPVIQDSVTARETFTYAISPVKLSTDIEIAPIKAAKMSGMPQEELYRFLMKTGFGNYTTPYFEVFYNSLRSRQNSYGIHYKHLSALGKMKTYAYPGYSENAFDANATLFVKNHLYHFSGLYQRDVVHFYGRPENLVNDTTNKETIRQRFHEAGFDAGLKSNYWGNDQLNHSLGLSYRMINDLYPTTEHGIALNGSLDKDVEWFKFSRSQLVGLTAKGEFFIAKAGDDTIGSPVSTVLVKVNPFIQTTVKELNVRVGAIAGYESDNNGKLLFFPDIRLSIALKDQKFLLLGGLEGNIAHSSFRTLALENPFVVSNPLMLNQITKIRAYGGLNSAIGKRVNFNARVSSESIKNLPMFVADTTLLFQNRFRVVYDDGSLLTVRGEIGFQAAEKVMITGLIQYQDYNMVTSGYAWHKPALTTGLDIRYNLENKILAYAGIQYLSGIKVQTFVNGVEVSDDLKDILDINLGFEYRYSNLLSGFLRLNNLASSRYYRWQNYPAQRFNMMLGITYAL